MKKKQFYSTPAADVVELQLEQGIAVVSTLVTLDWINSPNIAEDTAVDGFMNY